jgi:hypothetical protein
VTDETAAPEQAGGENKVAEWDRDVVNNLMGTPQGRFWMERLLDFCGAGRPTYADDGDALGMAKRDGRADIGRFLQGQLEEFCPDLFLRMVRERRGRAARAAAELRKLQGAGEPDVDLARTPIDELADEQERAAAEAAKRSATKPKKDR